MSRAKLPPEQAKAPLDLIVVLRKLGACEESIAWLEKRRAEDPGASFAKRWAEALEHGRACQTSWCSWAYGAANVPRNDAASCSCDYCDAGYLSKAATIAKVQRGLHAAFIRVATPAEVEAARMVRQ